MIKNCKILIFFLPFFLIFAFKAKANQLEIAENLIKGVASNAIGILSNEENSEKEKFEAFRHLLDKNVDTNLIAKFVIKSYWKDLTSEQQEEFINLFKIYIIKSYSLKLNSYSGEIISITGSKKLNEKYILVNSKVSKEGQNTGIEVDWRVKIEDEKMKIVDLVVEGISLAVAQRAEFTSIIENNNGDIEVLLLKLQNFIDN